MSLPRRIIEDSPPIEMTDESRYSFENFKKWTLEAATTKTARWVLSFAQSGGAGIFVYSVLDAIFPDHLFFTLLNYTASGLTMGGLTRWNSHEMSARLEKDAVDELLREAQELKLELLMQTVNQNAAVANANSLKMEHYVLNLHALSNIGGQANAAQDEESELDSELGSEDEDADEKSALEFGDEAADEEISMPSASETEEEMEPLFNKQSMVDFDTDERIQEKTAQIAAVLQKVPASSNSCLKIRSLLAATSERASTMVQPRAVSPSERRSFVSAGASSSSNYQSTSQDETDETELTATRLEIVTDRGYLTNDFSLSPSKAQHVPTLSGSSYSSFAYTDSTVTPKAATPDINDGYIPTSPTAKI